MGYFGYGDVEAFAQPIFQAFDDLPFVLQGMGVFDEDFQGQHSDYRDRHFKTISACQRIVRSKKPNELLLRRR